VYDLRAAPGSTFPTTVPDAFPTQEYSAMMDDRSRVGDTVDMVYPRSDPSQLQDARIAPVWWKDAGPFAILAVALAGLAVTGRRRLTKSHRLPRV
jgi:hypothetical protein